MAKLSASQAREYFYSLAKKTSLFSMKYGGSEIRSLTPDSVCEKNGCIIKEFHLPHGLTVEEKTTFPADYSAFETEIVLSARGEADTLLIEDLCVFDCVIPCEEDQLTGFPTDNDYAKVVSYRGWARETEECCPKNNYFIRKTSVYTFAPIQARSCDETMAYFDVCRKDFGAVCAIGWTAQWQARFHREAEGVNFACGLQRSHFVLHAGERVIYPTALLFFYDKGFEEGHNGFRRYMREISIVGKPNRAPLTPLALGTWGGFHEEIHETVLSWIERNNFPFEVYWMDAGWFGECSKKDAANEEAWYKLVGNWGINPECHPSKFQGVKAHAEKIGIKTLLWFELERAMQNSEEYQKHPDWYLGRRDGSDTADQFLLNWGNAEALEYTLQKLSSYIDSIGLSWYRPDFNVDALPYLRNNDEEDRQGVTELKYVEGLYTFLDRLLAKYPQLMVDNCAGGGNRMDYQMQKRTVTLWRSDYNCYADHVVEGLQAANMGGSLFFPNVAHGLHAWHQTMYRARSCYLSGMTVNVLHGACENAAEVERILNEQTDFIREVLKEYAEVREYYNKDFYAHSAFNADLYSWCAYQFHDPEKDEGVFHVFRRASSVQGNGVYCLKQIDEDKTYEVKSFDGLPTRVCSGKELLQGLAVDIPCAGESRLFVYRKV